MTIVALRALVAVALCLAAAATPSKAQVPPPAVAADGVSPRDCSRWPASVYDGMSGSCVCPQGMWWNLRGDACLPREHAAGEFCVTVWPSSSPFLIAGGGYRCVCAPPLMWDDQATACRPPAVAGEADCSAEWPGTLPVLSPSGTEFECRCPGGRRWDEGSRSCVAGAPVVTVSHGYYIGPSPGVPGMDAPAPGAGIPVAPGPAAPTPGYITPDLPQATPPGGDVLVPIPGAGTSVPSAKCESLLAEIRARAKAGQSAESDALGMKAAVEGCDPAAISDAARVR